MIDGVRVPKFCTIYFIVGVAGFFDDLFSRASGQMPAKLCETERVSEALGYWYYANYEFTDGYSVWVKACGDDGLITLERDDESFRVSKLVPCETIKQIAVGLKNLADDMLELRLKEKDQVESERQLSIVKQELELHLAQTERPTAKIIAKFDSWRGNKSYFAIWVFHLGPYVIDFEFSTEVAFLISDCFGVTLNGELSRESLINENLGCLVETIFEQTIRFERNLELQEK